MNTINFKTYFENYPNEKGYFGRYGGVYINEELMDAINEVNVAYNTIGKSIEFLDELTKMRKEFQGRPTPITYLEKLSNK